MNTRQVRHAVSAALATSIVLTIAAPANAEVVFDGTLGPGGSLSGDMMIPDTFGSQVGSNLFHSFSIFNVNTGESATFTSSFGGITDNVIARVTGGSLSTIDGLLSSSIAGADLWLINPSGVVFGDNATLSVPGSFHVSTADYLVLEDGGRFDASNPPATMLTMADPVAFGFIGPTTAPLSVGASTLQVDPGESLSLVGGDVDLNGSTLTAPGGRIILGSMGSAGEFQLDDADANRANLSGFGDVSLSSSVIGVDGPSGGDIYILGGQFVAGASLVSSASLGDEDGGEIRVDVDDLTLTDNSGIEVPVFGTGDGSSVTIDATGTVELIPGGDSGFGARIWGIAQSGSSGDVGGIAIAASDFDMQFSSLVLFQVANGQAGDLTLDIENSLNVLGNFGSTFANNSIDGANAGSVEVTAGDITFDGGSILVRAFGSGDAGRILLRSDNLSMSNGTQFTAGAFGIGAGGEVDIAVTDTITMTDDIGYPTLIASGSANGPGGGITVSSRILNILEGAEVTAGSFGGGVAGNVDIDVAEEIFVSGRPGVFTGIFSNAFSVGDAGNINISTPSLQLVNGGSVQASSFQNATGDGGTINIDVDDLLIGGDNSFISARTFASGNGGDIMINADAISMAGTEGTFDGIFAGTEGTGDAGSIVIDTTTLDIADGAFIQASTFSAGDAGSIIIYANGDITLSADTDPQSGIFNSTFGDGDAGSIGITASDLTVTGIASVQAATTGPGNGGAVDVDATNVSLVDGGSITALTQGGGNAGTIDIDATDTVLVTRGDLSQLGSGNVATSTDGSGTGGTISISGDTVLVEDSGVVSAAATADGDGGDIVIAGRIVEISDSGSVSASATGTGNAGTVLIIAVDDFLIDDALVATSSDQSAGGNIEFRVGTNFFMNDGATISAAANGVTPDDDGGNITIDPVFVVLRGSQILASANAGNGGNIFIEAGTFIIDADSTIDASSQTGLDGQVIIDSVNNIYGSVILLEAPNVQVSDIVTQRCVAQAFRDRSSLTVDAGSTSIWSPDDFAPSPYAEATSGAALAANASPSEPCYVTLTVRSESGAD